MPRFPSISPERMENLLRKVLKPHEIRTDSDSLEMVRTDETGIPGFPQMVIQPEDPAVLPEIFRICAEHRIPLTARGAGTGLSGGAVPIHGGIVLMTHQWNRIVDFVPQSSYVEVEPGIITGELQRFLEKEGFYYPPDPASRDSCFIGGNIAEDSAGPHTFKYGTTRRFVRNLQIATPSGEIFWTSAWTSKNTAGYNLTQLLVGSEGTLAIILRAVLHILPAPPSRILCAIPFPRQDISFTFITEVLQTGIYPSAIEWMEKRALKASLTYLQEIHASGGIPLTLDSPSFPEALLILELETGGDVREKEKLLERLYHLASEKDVKDFWIAGTPADMERIWQIRRVTGTAIKQMAPYVDADTVVPRHRLVDLLKALRSIEQEAGLPLIAYGHAGDGNLHVNILRVNSLDEKQWQRRLDQVLDRLFDVCVRLGGSITGEHGVGCVHARRLKRFLERPAYELMLQIKKIWDPAWILNPGKIFPVPDE